jgi:hypothetical protein
MDKIENMDIFWLYGHCWDNINEIFSMYETP